MVPSENYNQGFVNPVPSPSHNAVTPPTPTLPLHHGRLPLLSLCHQISSSISLVLQLPMRHQHPLNTDPIPHHTPTHQKRTPLHIHCSQNAKQTIKIRVPESLNPNTLKPRKPRKNRTEQNNHCNLTRSQLIRTPPTHRSPALFTPNSSQTTTRSVFPHTSPKNRAEPTTTVRQDAITDPARHSAQ